MEDKEKEVKYLEICGYMTKLKKIGLWSWMLIKHMSFSIKKSAASYLPRESKLL
jgi:hypothetical protein